MSEQYERTQVCKRIMAAWTEAEIEEILEEAEKRAWDRYDHKMTLYEKKAEKRKRQLGIETNEQINEQSQESVGEIEFRGAIESARERKLSDTGQEPRQKRASEGKPVWQRIAESRSTGKGPR